MASAKQKTAALDVTVPQSRDEAAEALRRIGDIARETANIEAAMNITITAAKTAAEERAKPLVEEGAKLLMGLQLWAIANREKITDGGKVKSCDLGTGTIGWRLNPAKANIRGTEDVLAAIKDKIAEGTETSETFKKFLRVKEEINKEAMIADPALANTIDGVSVKSAGETFYAEPLELQLAAADAAAAELRQVVSAVGDTR